MIADMSKTGVFIKGTDGKAEVSVIIAVQGPSLGDAPEKRALESKKKDLYWGPSDLFCAAKFKYHYTERNSSKIAGRDQIMCLLQL